MKNFAGTFPTQVTLLKWDFNWRISRIVGSKQDKRLEFHSYWKGGPAIQRRLWKLEKTVDPQEVSWEIYGILYSSGRISGYFSYMRFKHNISIISFVSSFHNSMRMQQFAFPALGSHAASRPRTVTNAFPWRCNKRSLQERRWVEESYIAKPLRIHKQNTSIEDDILFWIHV